MKICDRKSAVRPLAGLAIMCLLAGCAGTPGPSPETAPVAALTTAVPETETRSADSMLLRSPDEAFTLGPGDRLDIELVGDVSTRSRVVVGPDGKIYFYLLPGLDVWGLTLPETQTLISKELQRYVRQKQPVSLTLRNVESKRIWLLGRLGTPGVYPITGPTTLLEGISLAGGPLSASSFASLASASGVGLKGATDEAADLSRSFVIRQGRLLAVDFNRLLREGDLSQNIYLQPDDFVYLPSAAAQEVHVLGAVTQPRTVNFVNQLTLVQAVANAGGTIKDAYLSHVAIVRGSLAKPQIAVIDYQAVVRGRTPDVQLEPHDIVYVPYTPYRTLKRYADLILDTFVRTVGVNEGARAVSGSVAPVGVNVPVNP